MRNENRLTTPLYQLCARVRNVLLLFVTVVWVPFVQTSVKFINYSILLYIHNTEIYKTKRRDANKWTICISTKRIRLFFHIYLVHIVPTVLKTHLPVFDSMYGSYFLASRVNVHNKSFTHILKFIDVPTIVMLFLCPTFTMNLTKYMCNSHIPYYHQILG